MKKLILSACVALAGTFCLNAQKISYRAEIGANATAKYVTGGTAPGVHKPNYSMRAGLGVEYMLSPSMYLASGLNYRMGGLNSEYKLPQGKIKVKTREHNLSLPINFGLRFRVSQDFALSIEGGPFVAYTFSSQKKKGSAKFEDVLKHRDQFEWGAGLSVATEYMNRYTLRLGTDFGLTDTQKKRVGSLRKMTNEIYLTLGLRF